MSSSEDKLIYEDKINFGVFYTPPIYVEIVWKMITPFLSDKSVVLDTSCGYGNFLNYGIKCKKKGNDIDSLVIDKAKRIFPDICFYNKNALIDVERRMYDIVDSEELIIIGNPPYNDVTSIIRKNIKRNSFNIDFDIKTRDLGISFLLSYKKLNADVICVLHPLSYLIKKSNFNLLKNFVSCYKLIDGIIIDSSTFQGASKKISFPIIIALYKKDENGMDYEYVKQYRFRTIEDKFFRLSDFDFITNYINKYPKKNIGANEF